MIMEDDSEFLFISVSIGLNLRFWIIRAYRKLRSKTLLAIQNINGVIISRDIYCSCHCVKPSQCHIFDLWSILYPTNLLYFTSFKYFAHWEFLNDLSHM